MAASDVELAEFLGCNRKTIGKLIDNFNRLGMLTTRTNNRTSVHSLHFLTGWYVGGVLTTNPHYVRPSATAKGQTGDVQTPVSDGSPSENGQDAAPDESQSKGQEADSMAAGAAVLPSSLCSSETSNPSADRPDGDSHNPPPDIRVADEAGNLPFKESEDGVPERNTEKAPKRRRTERLAERMTRIRRRGNERRRTQIWTSLCLQGVSYRTCPGIAHYNISATLQCCGLSRGA